MPVVQNLYQVYKLTSTQIVAADLNIVNYTKLQASRDGTLVSIGDNLVFHKIRDFYGDKKTPEEIFNQVQEMRHTLHICKREGKIAEARIVNQCIGNLLFVKDIINVEVVKKSDYKKLAKNGFYVNGVHYIRFLAGAGQIRRNTATFINADLFDYVQQALMCGLEGKIKEINLAKLGAYFALSFSSVMWVRTPKVCVIKDFETVIPKQRLDFIYTDDNGKDHIEERVMDITLNSADGQGLISPELATAWGEDMYLDYTPSSFVVRAPFIKGNLVPFDFKTYGKVHDIHTIKDRWGVEYNLDDIDVLISESQFKMYNRYESWAEYENYFNQYNLRWGVARYNRKYDDENVLANYQYLQVLKMNKEDIQELIAPTVDWLQKICQGDLLYTLMFLFGCKNENMDYRGLYSCAQTTFAKAVVKNVDMLHDTYVQKKIYHNIVESINKAKIGKIWVRGNYQFMISDPIAQCRSALGLSPDGLIPAKHVYSNFWRERKVTGQLDLCRSPMIDKSEHNVSTIFENTEADFWYQYIKSGVIFSIYDIATIIHSDSDWDGDIVFSTDNPVFLRCAQTQYCPITYEKSKVPSQKNTMSNRIKTDIRGFGTAVGSFSNCTTIIEAMKAIFNPETQASQIEELTDRQRYLRRIVGNEIDKIKGVAAPRLPSSWRKFVKVNPDDDDITKAEKYRHNSLVISKKPYFFRYLYPELNKRYKQYENAYNLLSLDMFGIKLKKLLAKKDKTEEEKVLVRRYQKFNPLIVSNCVMNILCRAFENIDFDIKYRHDNVNMLPTFEDCGFIVRPEILKTFREAYRRYCNKKGVKMVEGLFKDYDAEETVEIYNQITDSIKEEIQLILFDLNLSHEEMLFYIAQLAKEYKKFNWSFAWDILEDYILELIPQGATYLPIRNEDRGVEYLGGRYLLKDITQEISQYEPDFYFWMQGDIK